MIEGEIEEEEEEQEEKEEKEKEEEEEVAEKESCKTNIKGCIFIWIEINTDCPSYIVVSLVVLDRVLVHLANLSSQIWFSYSYSCT